MKRFLSLKSLSRTVHNDHDDDDDDGDQDQRLRFVGGHVNDAVSSLTVWRKSLLINCNGFTVIDSHGDLIYRVDNYIGRPEETILMDSHGKSVLTIRRRMKLGLVVERWFVYEGEVGGDQLQMPIFCIRKNIINLLAISANNKRNVLARIYRDASYKKCAYAVEGSYTHRCCKVLDVFSKKVVAETKRKEEIVNGVSFGVEVFQLIVQPGFDTAFAMALVLILDQMFS